MTAPSCRLCNASLPDADSLTIDRAPAGAQSFLDTAEYNPENTGAIQLTITECAECGLVQSVSPPVSYYRRVITAAGLSAAMREHRLKQASTFVNAHGLQGKPVVEIGSYSDYFLSIVRDAGAVPVGTQAGGNPGEGNTGQFQIVDFYPEPGEVIPGGPFAGFFCLNFLEHAPDARRFLRGIRENLEMDGCGLIEVPNYRQQRRCGRVFDYVADHLSYFDMTTLQSTLNLSGFVVERLEETRGGENLEAWIRRRPSSGLQVDAELIGQTYAKLRSWMETERASGRTVAVWGASHQALTLLAQLGNHDVFGIIDSAPFKQGRYAPVTRLPILKPTVETVSQVDTVLIIASGYENEIASTLRQRLSFKGRMFFMEKGRPTALAVQS